MVFSVCLYTTDIRDALRIIPIRPEGYTLLGFTCMAMYVLP